MHAETLANIACEWSFSKKMAFRFFFLLFVLYIFFNPNGFLPYSDVAFEYYILPFHQLIPWIGKNILHLSTDITVFTNGSGDTTYDFVVVFFTAIIASAGCIIWTLLDRDRKNYNNLHYWLTAIMRYYLAFTMFSYGFVKIYKLQFPYPSPDRLLESYGDSSPMGLAWTFIGYSKGYNYFTGFGEVIAGLLLLFKKTTTLGAMLSLVIAGNIMAINYSFDIPVKLLSTALVIMCLFLLARDIKRLNNFFILNKPSGASDIKTPEFRKRWVNITSVFFKYGLIAFVLYSNISGAISGMAQYGDEAKKPPLYGIYNVESFVKNNDSLPPITTDTVRWNKIIVSWPGSVKLKMMNESYVWYAFEPDTVAKRIIMYSWDDTTKKSSFVYTIPSKDKMIMRGKWNNDSLIIRCTKYDLSNFLLMNRGFHWVNEYPMNR
ncbi:hypothetical protein BH10BAC2_BH10BAC2_06480 [soil metagenome]